MPTYDYECSACGHKFEEFQSIKAEPIQVCPVCKKKKVRRLIGAGAGIIFKGSGFYCTDYRDSGSRSSAGSSDKPKTETTSSTAASESKPAAETKPAASTAATETKTPQKKAS